MALAGKVALWGLGTVVISVIIAGIVLVGWKIRTQQKAIRHLANVAFQDVKDSHQNSVNAGDQSRTNGGNPPNSLFDTQHSFQTEGLGGYHRM